MNDATPVMPQDDKTVQQTESHGWDDEEVDRHNVADVVLEERSPRLRRGLRWRHMYSATVDSATT
jgi:hypothetical protein